jgi:hypothetical protein
MRPRGSFIFATHREGDRQERIMTAASWGTVPATIAGSAGSVLIAMLWARLFPSLRDVE